MATPEALCYYLAMFRHTLRMTLMACVVAFALTSGGLIHSIVPHHHSHDESGATSEIWTGMHQALHSVKKLALDVSNAFPDRKSVV